MPLSLTSEEMDVLVSLSAPLDPTSRAAFTEEVSEALATIADRGAGVVFRTARTIQRRYWSPPQLAPESAAPRHGPSRRPLVEG